MATGKHGLRERGGRWALVAAGGGRGGLQGGAHHEVPVKSVDQPAGQVRVMVRHHGGPVEGRQQGRADAVEAPAVGLVLVVRVVEQHFVLRQA
jgi:hypothetical protein